MSFVSRRGFRRCYGEVGEKAAARPPGALCPFNLWRRGGDWHRCASGQRHDIHLHAAEYGDGSLGQRDELERRSSRTAVTTCTCDASERDARHYSGVLNAVR